MTEMHTWEKEFDRWVIQTDGATVLLEFAAADLTRSKDPADRLADIKYGSYLGTCMAMAVLSGVPVGVVQGRVMAMVGEVV